MKYSITRYVNRNFDGRYPGDKGSWFELIYLTGVSAEAKR